MRNNNVFDRSVAFTFYKEWKQDADTIEEDFGSEVKAAYYDAIINYALFEIEPEMKAPIKYFWNSIKEKIDSSQKNRSKGFREDTDLSQKILDYKATNPTASQRNIAEAVNCSVGKVNKVLNTSTDNNNNTSTTTNTNTNTTMNVNVNAITDDIKLAIIDMFKTKTKYHTIQNKIKTDFDIDISFDDIKQVIDNREELEAEIKHNKAIAPTNQVEKADYERFDEVIAALANKGIDTTFDDIVRGYRFSVDLKHKSWTVDEMIAYINKTSKQCWTDYVNGFDSNVA